MCVCVCVHLRTAMVGREPAAGRRAGNPGMEARVRDQNPGAQA